MNKIKRLVLSAFLISTAGAASAQGGSGSAEALRQSSEMNKPLVATRVQGSTTGGKSTTVRPADRQADEVIRNTDMMKSPTFGPVTATPAAPLLLNEDARKVAETMTRTDSMKPN